MQNNTVHDYILQEVKENLINLLLSHKKRNAVSLNNRELLGIIFKNYRTSTKGHKGLRLSYLGDRVCCKHFASYTYKLEEAVQNQAILSLDRNMLWPYYIGKEHISFYSQDDAAWFQLNGSNINTYGDFI